MSSKGAHVQDNLVLERRLRPIYDWLDSGNYKKAIQECDKVLKKSPNLDRARALKALSLLRLGKENECTSILDALTAQKPSDDSILQAMTMCYRELQQLDRISKLYETAVKIDPSNEELHTHLFMSYVRISDFKAQQQSAMALYKLTPKNPYYCWAVMSVILQATRNPLQDDKKKRLLLSLAERMIDKLIQENKLEAEQEVQLYVMVLEAQEKYEEVLNVLDGPLGGKLSNEQMRFNVLIKLKRWTEVNAMCKKILSESMDRWDVWKIYIESVLELHARTEKRRLLNKHDSYRMNISKDDGIGKIMKQMKIMSVETNRNGDCEYASDEDDVVDDEIVDNVSLDNSYDKAHDFICKMMETCGENGVLLRGPYLARFELAKQLADRYRKIEYAVQLLGNVCQLFTEYFKKFGYKSCCVSDLRGYLYLLDDCAKIGLAGVLLDEVGVDEENVPECEIQMQRHICALQIARLCGKLNLLKTPIEHINKLIKSLSKQYLHGKETFGRELLTTDQAPADAYILFAAHVLYDLHVRTDSSKPLITALLLLKRTLNNSPSNFHIKLLMLKLYHTLGCVQGAEMIYESLDIKHLQLDSMCFIHCARLAMCGNYSLAGSLFDTTLKFFSTNYKDSSEFLTFSYKYGSFQKLTELMAFRERMNHSFHYTLIAVDRMFLSLIQCFTLEQVYGLDISVRDDPIDWNEIRNNSDFNVYVSWDPERITNGIEEWPETKLIYQQELVLLKIRVSVLNLLQAALQLINKPDMKISINQLELELNQLKLLYEEVHGESKESIIQPRLLVMPFPSRLEAFKSMPYSIKMFEAIVSIASDNYQEADLYLKQVQIDFHLFIKNVCDFLQPSVDVLVKRRFVYEAISQTIEVTSLLSILYTICVEMLKGAKRSKKKSSCNEGKIRETLQNLVIGLKEDVMQLDGCLELYGTQSEEESEWKKDIISYVHEQSIALQLNDELDSGNVNEDEDLLYILEKSHDLSIKEFRSILKQKLKLLNIS